jgi:RNA polymerase sigma-70 factor (ECF subfamily)
MPFPDRSAKRSESRDPRWRPRVSQGGTTSVTGGLPGLDHDAINALMARVAVHRDIDAFEILYRHFTPKVRSYMQKVTKDVAAADELTQEALTIVWRKADQFDPDRGRASTWIFTIARNLRIDALRRGPRPDFDEEDPMLAPERIEPADIGYQRAQEAEQVRNAINGLNAEQMQVLKMSYFEDMTHVAIATALNIPLGTVKSRIRMACEKLRASLGGRI